jgi:hypothetical protein
MKRVLKLQDNMYGQDIYVGFNLTYKQFNAIIKKKWRVKNDVTLPPQADGISVQLNTGWLIYVQKDDIPTLAHESLHVAQNILERSGTYLIPATKEVYAYYLWWLMNEVITPCKVGKK